MCRTGLSGGVAQPSSARPLPKGSKYPPTGDLGFVQ